MLFSFCKAWPDSQAAVACFTRDYDGFERAEEWLGKLEVLGTCQVKVED